MAIDSGDRSVMVELRCGFCDQDQRKFLGGVYDTQLGPVMALQRVRRMTQKEQAGVQGGERLAIDGWSDMDEEEQLEAVMSRVLPILAGAEPFPFRSVRGADDPRDWPPEEQLEALIDAVVGASQTFSGMTRIQQGTWMVLDDESDARTSGECRCRKHGDLIVGVARVRDAVAEFRRTRRKVVLIVEDRGSIALSKDHIPAE